MYDVVIIGAGPAAWSAGIYTARAGLKTVVIGILKNSNAYKAHIIENYWGYEKAVSGPFLMEQGKVQAMRFGAEFVEREVVDIKQNQDGTFAVSDTETAEYSTKTVIICSGLGFKPSGIKNEQALTGKGISFCVMCDGFFFKQKNIAVIGNTNFAGDEALQLLAYTPKVAILSHGKEFEFTPKMKEALEKNSIALQKSPKVSEFIGAEKLEKLRFANSTEAAFDGVFIALGIASASDFANKLGIARFGPQNAFIVADPRTGETNVKGVYAAGDCTGGNAQAAKSSGEGCNAGISIIKLLKGMAAYVDYS